MKKLLNIFISFALLAVISSVSFSVSASGTITLGDGTVLDLSTAEPVSSGENKAVYALEDGTTVIISTNDGTATIISPDGTEGSGRYDAGRYNPGSTGGDSSEDCRPGFDCEEGDTQQCGLGYLLNPETGNCEEKRCPEGSIYDPSKLQCISNKCMPGEVFDEAKKSCVPSKTCPAGQKFDILKNICVESKDCPAGQTATQQGVCEETKTCPAGQTYDEAKKTCIPSKTCPDGQTYDAEKNTCIETKTCPEGQTLDDKNECVETEACEPGFIYVEAEKKCVEDKTEGASSSGGTSGGGSSSSGGTTEVRVDCYGVSYCYDGTDPIMTVDGPRCPITSDNVTCPVGYNSIEGQCQPSIECEDGYTLQSDGNGGNICVSDAAEVQCAEGYYVAQEGSQYGTPGECVQPYRVCPPGHDFVFIEYWPEVIWECVAEVACPDGMDSYSGQCWTQCQQGQYNNACTSGGTNPGTCVQNPTCPDGTAHNGCGACVPVCASNEYYNWVSHTCQPNQPCPAGQAYDSNTHTCTSGSVSTTCPIGQTMQNGVCQLGQATCTVGTLQPSGWCLTQSQGYLCMDGSAPVNNVCPSASSSSGAGSGSGQ